MIKLEVGASAALSNYHPKSTTDLNGPWAEVAHSADGANPYMLTNLDYSTVEGTNIAIYVKSEQGVEFFSIEIQ